jgi:hypothetical protein
MSWLLASCGLYARSLGRSFGSWPDLKQFRVLLTLLLASLVGAGGGGEEQRSPQ